MFHDSQILTSIVNEVVYDHENREDLPEGNLVKRKWSRRPTPNTAIIYEAIMKKSKGKGRKKPC